MNPLKLRIAAFEAIWGYKLKVHAEIIFILILLKSLYFGEKLHSKGSTLSLKPKLYVCGISSPWKICSDSELIQIRRLCSPGCDNKIRFVGTRGLFQLFRPSKRDL